MSICSRISIQCKTTNRPRSASQITYLNYCQLYWTNSLRPVPSQAKCARFVENWNYEYVDDEFQCSCSPEMSWTGMVHKLSGLIKISRTVCTCKAHFGIQEWLLVSAPSERLKHYLRYTPAASTWKWREVKTGEKERCSSRIMAYPTFWSCLLHYVSALRDSQCRRDVLLSSLQGNYWKCTSLIFSFFHRLWDDTFHGLKLHLVRWNRLKLRLSWRVCIPDKKVE